MAYLRGHEIYRDDKGEFRFKDNGELTAPNWKKRPCGHCHKMATPEGHDACMGTLHGVMNACCGHGEDGKAYVQFNPAAIAEAEKQEESSE